MYCSACGTAVIGGLSYCNRCGARLRDSGTAANDAVKPAETFSESLVWAIVTVFIVGIGCSIGLMAVMKEVLQFPNEVILAVVAVAFFLIFLLEGVFIWLLLSSRKTALAAAPAARTTESGDAGQSLSSANDLVTKELYAPPAATVAGALSEPSGIPSVVEHTTHSLEPVLVERKSK